MATKISTILDRIDNGSLALPVFQRGYVWNREQVRELFTSLYRDHPVGSLLVWETSSPEVKIRGDAPIPVSPLQLLLDGQQRMTSLYGVMRGREPDFFDGNANAFTRLQFHLEDEIFEFYQPVKMQNDPLWIDVSNLYKNDALGIQPIIQRLNAEGIESSQYMHRISTLLSIKNNRDFHIDLVTGEDKTVDVVVQIFNRVNSGGTKLTQADLALAKICADWPEARETMQSKLAKWKDRGYDFNLDWLLRVLNAIITRKARFVNLHDVQSEMIQEGLHKAEIYIDKTLNMISNRIGLDHSQVLFSQHAIALFAAFLDKNGGNMTPEQRDKLLYWYVQSGMWRRYSGSPDSTLEVDLSIIDKTNLPDKTIDKLIEEIRLSRGGLKVEAQHFHGATRRVRFYSVLYMLTRMGQALDFGDGIPLKKHQIGQLAQLELHHIFPKSQLKKEGYDYKIINALSNFCFLTKETNLRIGHRLPSDYFAEVERTHPGALQSQWIPQDPKLWEVKRYPQFIEERKKLLAKATNTLLNDLLSGHPYTDMAIDNNQNIARDLSTLRPSSIADDEEEELLNEINQWLISKGLPPGILGYEIVDPVTEQTAMFDLAWPDGVQAELSEPVAVLIDEDVEVLAIAGRNGYRFFTSSKGFKQYISDEILMLPNGNAIQELIQSGESENFELKSTLRMNLYTKEKDRKMEDSVIKTLAGFLNHNGGTLLIGVADDGTILGIDVDKFETADKMSLHLVNLIKSRIDPSTAMTSIHIDFATYKDKQIMKVVCDPSPFPVYVQDGNQEHFFVRMGPSTDKLTIREIQEYIKHRFDQ